MAGTSGRIGDELRFLKGIVRTPRITGAVSPSGAALARLMASHVDPEGTDPVLELGPGTGPVTKALIEHGVAPERIVALEFSPEFCALLGQRFPGIRVVQGDAYRLGDSLPADLDRPFSAVVSGLPLLMRPPAERQALIEAALDRMRPGGPFIQFSYSLMAPVPAVPGRFTVDRSRWVMLNLPPARVWLYRRVT